MQLLLGGRHGVVLVIGRKEGGDEALPEGGHDGHHVEPAAEGLRQLDGGADRPILARGVRSEEHTSELQSLMRISYAVFCLKKKKSRNSSHISAYHSQYHTLQSRETL